MATLIARFLGEGRALGGIPDNASLATNWLKNADIPVVCTTALLPGVNLTRMDFSYMVLLIYFTLRIKKKNGEEE